MSERSLVDAYLEGQLDRRGFIKRLAAVGVSAASAASLAEVLRAQPAGAHRRGSGHHGGSDGPNVPNPTVTGPVPSSVGARRPGARLPVLLHSVRPREPRLRRGGVFLEGTANRYTVVNGQLTTASVVDGGHPYRTRMVVRRPADRRRLQRHGGGRVVQRHRRLRRRGELVPIPRGDPAGRLRVGRRLGAARWGQLPAHLEPHPLRGPGRDRGRRDHQRRARLGRLLAGAAGDPAAAGRRSARSA